jgi:hypothetical protein
MYIHKNRSKKDNYTILDNKEIHNKNLSFKATGLYAYLVSLPDDWKIKVEDLKNRKKDGRDAINAAILELIKEGYLYREKARNEKGQLRGYVYEFYEYPEENPYHKRTQPTTENPVSVNPVSEKPQLLNKQKTKETITNNKKAADAAIDENSKDLSQDKTSANAAEKDENTLNQLQEIKNACKSLEKGKRKYSLSKEIENQLIQNVLFRRLYINVLLRKKSPSKDILPESFAKVLITWCNKTGRIPTPQELDTIHKWLRFKDVEPAKFCDFIETYHEQALFQKDEKILTFCKLTKTANAVNYGGVAIKETTKPAIHKTTVGKKSDFLT